MKPLKYILRKNPLATAQGAYVAQVLHNGKVDEVDIARSTAVENSTFAESDLPALMNLFKKVALENLMNGNKVFINDFISFSLSIKGSFKAHDSGFNPQENSVHVNCQVSKSFIKEVQEAISVNKVKPQNTNPVITNIWNKITDSNVIHSRYINTIDGNYFSTNGNAIDSLTIISRKNKAESIKVPLDNLGINSFSKSAIEFLFLENFKGPEWLKKGLPIYLRLTMQDTHDNGKEITSNDFDSVWSA